MLLFGNQKDSIRNHGRTFCTCRIFNEQWNMGREERRGDPKS